MLVVSKFETRTGTISISKAIDIGTSEKQVKYTVPAFWLVYLRATRNKKNILAVFNCHNQWKNASKECFSLMITFVY